MKTKFLSILCLVLLSATEIAQENPHIMLSNGLLKVKVFLPDSGNGFYKGPKFDLAGVIPKLEFKGHSFFGRWYTWPKDTLKQNIIMGPVEGFDPLGYSESKAGDFDITHENTNAGVNINSNISFR